MGPRRAVRAAPFVLLLMLAAGLLPLTPLSGSADAQVTCCEAHTYDFVLIGEGDGGKLSPFAADLGQEQEAWVNQSTPQRTEIAKWVVSGMVAGDYPEKDWRFELSYEVENAAGMQVNATVEVRIGDRTYEAGTWTNPTYSPGTGTIEIDVPVDAGRIHSIGDVVIVTFSVETLIFNAPGDDAGVRFVWGTEENRGFISVELPLLEMDWQPPMIQGHVVHFPVVLRSGFGQQMWDKTLVEFRVDGVAVSTVIATTHPDGVQAILTWQAPASAEDGVYTVNLSLRIDPAQTIPFDGGIQMALTFGDNGGAVIGMFPPAEPLRSGGSDLSVNINAEVDSGDRLRRMVSIEFSGPMAQWVRWGLDNIGNDSLDSISIWRDVSPTSSTEAVRNNQQIDDVEIQALVSHLSGRASSLQDFLFDGLMLEPERLLGIRPVEAAASPSVRINLHGERGFSSTRVTITIDLLENIRINEKMVLFDTFVRVQPSATPFWTVVVIEAHLRTSAMVGCAAVDGMGVDYTHNRVLVTERIDVARQTLTSDGELGDFSVVFVFGSVVHSPLLSFIESLALLGVVMLFAWLITRGKSRTGIWLSLPALLAVWLVSYILALPLPFLLGAVGAAGLLLLVIAFVTPRTLDEESLLDALDAFATIIPGRGGRKRRLPVIPVVICPACSMRNPVASEERPYRMPCGGCGARLRID